MNSTVAPAQPTVQKSLLKKQKRRSTPVADAAPQSLNSALSPSGRERLSDWDHAS
jgi:hypothetical protein